MILNNFYQYLLKKVEPEIYEDYVLFSGPTVFTLNGYYNSGTHIEWDGAVYYSTNGIKYNSWDKSVITAALDTSDNLYKIYLRGVGNTYFRGSGWYAMKMTGSNVSVSGSLDALLDAPTVAAGGHPSTLAYKCLPFIFREFSSVISFKDLKLPPTASGSDCYYGTFSDCPNVLYPPKIFPALAIATSAYQELFQNNTSMVEAPIILAKQHTSSYAPTGHIYYHTFKNCSSLVTPAPFIYESNSANQDCQEMYMGCTSLTRIPRLTSAMDYQRMFEDCSNIKISETQDSTYQYAFTLPSGGNYTNMFSNTGGSFTGTPTAGTTYYTDHPLVEPYYPIHFSSANSFTIAQNTGAATWDGTIEYSTDEYNWTTWDGTTITAVSDGSKYHLYFRGTGNTKIGDDGSTNYWTVTGSNVSVSGEMDALMDYSDTIARTGVTITDGAYAGWLKGQTAIVDASTLIIATVNTSNSCAAMFNGCTSLTGAPYLPSTTLEYRCYIDMFNGCTSLVEAPELPATNLEGDCYYAMFGGCTALTEAPKLPSTSLRNNCYREMFKGCSSLVDAPKLPATTMYDSSYYQMFMDCTSLVKAPALPATSLEFYCYYEMFNGCTSLTQPPALPATAATLYCYQGMFMGCTSLVKAPLISATTVAVYCFDKMFKDCTSLTQPPALPVLTLAQNCYSDMFNGCTSLVVAPSLPATTLDIGCYAGMFQGCTNLEVIPDMTSATFDSGLSWVWANTFYGCSKVKVYTDSSKGTLFMVGMGDWNMDTFTNTTGDYTGDANNGVSYYTSNQLV